MFNFKTFLFLGASLGGVGIAGPALAQSADGGVESDATFVAPDIIITARKRQETVQTLAQSIRAMGEDELLKLGADSLQDVIAVTPGIQSTGNRTTTQIVVRGVTTGPVNHDQAEIKETVGLYLDDTPIAVQRYSPNLSIYDLSRVEVLRGPQGTLYGAGSMAGAVRYITNKPDASGFDASARASIAGVSHGEENYSGDVMVNVPVVQDKLAVRAVGSVRQNGGFIDNVTTGEANTNDESSVSGRLMIRATPSEDLTIDTLLLYQRTKIDAASTYAREAGYLNTFTYVDEPVKDRNFLGAVAIAKQLDAFDITANASYRRKKYDYEIENGSFTHYVTGFEDSLGGIIDNIANQRDYNGELRISSKTGSPIEWTAGVYYEDRKNVYGQDMVVPGVDAVAGIDSADYGALPDQIYFSSIRIKEKQFAAFGEVVVPLLSELKFTAGGRYFHSKQNAEIDFRGIFAAPNIGVARFKNKESGFNPRFNLSWQIDRDRMVYAQAAKGFRLGGTNEPVPLPACQADLEQRGLNSPPTSYNSDSLWNYEVGAKTAWLDRRMTFNISAYRIDWKNPQVTDQLGCGFNVFVNAGGLRIHGIEIDTAITPLENMTLRAGLGYTDSELTEDTTFVGGFKGDHSPYIAKWMYSLSADYRFPLNDRLNGMFFANYSNVSRRFTRYDRSSTNAVELPAYGMLNVRSGVSTDKWAIELFVDNLANSKGIVDERYNPYKMTAATIVTPITPRTIGLELSLKY